MESYSAMRTSFTEGESISKDLYNLVITTPPSIQEVHLGEENTIIRELPSCQNTDGWERCRLQWNSTWNAHSLKSRSYLADSCVSSGLVFCLGTERLANWRDHPHTQERQERMH